SQPSSSVEFIARACGGELATASPAAIQVCRVCTDSRRVQAGDLFVALVGDRFDGHDFLEEARRKGASVLMVEKAKAPPSFAAPAIIRVDDTRLGLGRLGARYRREFEIPVVAVGGSNGKTTSKELVAAVLRRKMPTLSSEASFNNDIGVPLTLLNLERTHQAAVLEVGTNHPGELAPLVRMIQPRYGVITGLGREHMEFFADMAGVTEEEGWLAELLPAEGKLFVNQSGCGPFMDRLCRRSTAPVIKVGNGRETQWRASGVKLDEGGTSFRVEAPLEDFSGPYRINLLGRHQVVNALLAVAVGAELGLSPGEIRAGLESCSPLKMRLEPCLARGIRILNDAYNANADSVAAALETLHDLPCAGRRVAVLGDMAEQGHYSVEAHAEVGRRAAESRIDALIAVGNMAETIGEAARAAGLGQVFEFGEIGAAAGMLRDYLKAGDLVLLKASRAARLEGLAERLRKD
ncbi:MAG: UDP-N-acetylmuramoyl-tripeptide--D-alanyl-D-alanine ligase, partial [Candidatus Omnitrophica bacterium]|nr:UDP-N-acetylmuramoyl-tripeptide--D-alanyl-D-alanine ligase [Candidatus Omnitrophota bacterium]